MRVLEKTRFTCCTCYTWPRTAAKARRNRAAKDGIEWHTKRCYNSIMEERTERNVPPFLFDLAAESNARTLKDGREDFNRQGGDKP